MVKRQLAERQYKELPIINEADGISALIPHAKNITNMATTLVQKRDEMNINNMMADANTEMANYTAQWQQKNISDPFNPNAVQSLKQGYDEIFERYGGKVSFQSRGQWNQARNKVVNNFMQSNLRWGTSQSVKNAEASVNLGMEKSNDLAHQYGESGADQSLAEGLYDSMATSITNAFSGIKSDQEIAVIKDNLKSDNMKSYIQGVSNRSPDEALALLQNEKVREAIGSEDATKLLTTTAETKLKRIDTNLKLFQKTNGFNVSQKMIDDPDAYSYQQLEKMKVGEQISKTKYDSLVAFKQNGYFGETVKVTAYNRISDMTDGKLRKKDGERYSPEEIQQEIQDSSSDLTESAANTLSKSVTKELDEEYNETIKLEADGLKAVLYRTVGSNVSLDKIKGEHKGKIDQIMYQFHKKVRESGLNAQGVKDLAREMKIQDWTKVDPSFQPEPGQNLNKLEISTEGELAMDADGNIMKVINGRWTQVGNNESDRS